MKPFMIPQKWVCIVMYGCEKWTIKKSEHQKLIIWTVVFQKTLVSPLDWKIKPINAEGNQSWIFIGGTDAEAEALIFWPPDAESWLIRKDPDAGKDWKQEEKGTTGDKMVGWHSRLNGHEFEQAPGDSEGQGSLACCSPCGHKESDLTGWLNNSRRWGGWASRKVSQVCFRCSFL